MRPTVHLELDPKFRKYPLRFAGQCALVSLVIVGVLYVLDGVANAAVVGALGATSFIAFAMPHYRVSKSVYLIGGYLVGVTVGIVCYWGNELAQSAELPVGADTLLIVFAALSTGMAIFFMVILNFEHPPAAGVALGLVLNRCSWVSVGIVIGGVLLLTAVRRLLKPKLIDLL